MLITVDIPDDLLREAKKLTGINNTSKLVKIALENLINVSIKKKMFDSQGKTI